MFDPKMAKKSIIHISEELAGNEDVEGRVWSLRETVCKVMKKRGYIDRGKVCSEEAVKIDRVIKKVLDQI